MLVEWVNHAGFVLRSGQSAVLIDPWIAGLVFDDSWSQLTRTKFTYEDFARVSHIWFSHEHPDHFLPPNLRQIPEGYRSKIQVMFQETPDKRVVDACRKLRFESVIELSSGWQALASEGPPGSTAGDMEILCRPADRGNSWAAFRTADHTLLNMNDCIYLTEADLVPIKRAVGDVDTLVTQFSYASWWGNATDPDAWRVAAREQLEKIRREVEVLRPKFVLLSASFVYFAIPRAGT
jgi:hypothetical protein